MVILGQIRKVEIRHLMLGMAPRCG
jgi:hypothetical protein